MLDCRVRKGASCEVFRETGWGGPLFYREQKEERCLEVELGSCRIGKLFRFDEFLKPPSDKILMIARPPN